jgi:proliferating cell nuclear antigen
MKLTLDEPAVFKDGISILSDIITESTIEATEDGLEVEAMDPANVSKVTFTIPKDAFSTYDVDDDAEIAINFNNLQKILRRLNKNDTLVLERQENKLKLIYKGSNTKTYYVPLIDLEDRSQSLKDLDAEVNVSMPGKLLSEAIDDVDVVSESVKFTAEPGKLTISAEGDMSRADVELTESEDVTIKTDGTQTSRYSIEYLKNMIQARKICDEVTVRFSQNYPIMLDYDKEDSASMNFILAPRVDNI